MKGQWKRRVSQQHRETKGEGIDVLEDEGMGSKKRDYRSQEGKIDFKNVMQPEKKGRLEWKPENPNTSEVKETDWQWS